MRSKSKTKILLAICLSTATTGCAGLPEAPQGWSCTVYLDHGDSTKSAYICTQTRAPNDSREFKMDDPKFKNAQCMDRESYKAYMNYVHKLRDQLIACRMAYI